MKVVRADSLLFSIKNMRASGMGKRTVCDALTEMVINNTIEAEPRKHGVIELTYEEYGELCSYALADEQNHGDWLIDKSGSLMCSKCGTLLDEAQKPSRYCPNCGAKMDESTMGQVKHGHWVKYGSPLFSEWECSECGERHTGDDLPDKCPHCGAKMDEVEE